MKKIIFIILITFTITKPLKIIAINDTAKSSIVMDLNSGRVLYEKNSNEQLLIASTTKIMTAVVALENSNIEKEFTVGNEILDMYGTSIYLEVNEKIKLKDLLYGLLLRSGNDAAVVIANNICNTEKSFVKLMNKKAKDLKMDNTHFENAHGLDEKSTNFSTANDMVKLAQYANKIKIYREIVKTQKYSTKTNKKSYCWYNRNNFLKSYKYATGGKNGYTPKAGKTLVTTAKKNSLSIATVSLNDSDPFPNHETIDNYVFNKYSNEVLIDKENFSIPNYNNKNIYIKRSFKYPLTDKEKDQIKTIININKNKQDNVAGNVTIYLNNNIILKEKIYIKENKLNIFERIKNKLKNIID